MAVLLGNPQRDGFLRLCVAEGRFEMFQVLHSNLLPGLLPNLTVR
jgi:hypothetical protein